MTLAFNDDPYPRNPRILFVGNGLSSHTHAWIDLLRESRLNYRLFALPYTAPPPEWNVKTYVCDETLLDGCSHETRLFLSPPRDGQEPHELRIRAWLAEIIRRWQPHVIHTLGLDPASYLYLSVLQESVSSRRSIWVAQCRGGPDLALNRFLEGYRDRIKRVLWTCDYFIADNSQNYMIAMEMGLSEEKICSMGVVPGTGGIDVGELNQMGSEKPSQRQRIVVWPKAYECPQSKALPIFEALRLAWDDIRPCEVYLTAVVQDEIIMWYHQMLPDEIRKSCHLMPRIDRQDLMRLLSQARILLAPSLSDGIPNSLYEAMASGAFPIFSPLETIKGVVTHEENVLFARNLYPAEIAAALVRGMTDDHLVDEASEKNLELVSRIANRALIGPRVVAFYEQLAKELPYGDLLNQIQELNIRLDSELAERDARLTARDAEIAARDAEIAARDAEIAARDAEIAARDAEIAARDAEIAHLSHVVDAIRNSRSWRIMAPIRRIREIFRIT